jgi:cell wall assembly regulator SMI1
MDIIQQLISDPKWSNRPPATAADIKLMEDTFGKLPADYQELLEKSNGGGLYGYSTTLVIWSVKEVTQLHEEGDYYEYIPESLIFGSDGGGTVYCFDLRPGKDHAVFFIRHEDSSSEPDAYDHVRYNGPGLSATIARILNNEKLL